MFDTERWNEIWMTLRRNKLRSVLTMFGVFWGIFMLVIMLGMGRGLNNGVMGGFEGWATNSCFMWTQVTSLPYAGFKRGRSFDFDNSDIAALQKVEGVDKVAPRLQLGGWRGSNNVSYKGRNAAFNVNGDMPEVMEFQAAYIPRGRFLNRKDILEARKVCVIGPKVVEALFKNEDPIGKHIRIQGVYFQVVGEHKPKATAQMDEGDQSTIYIPFSTFQRAFNSMNLVHWFSISAKPGVNVADVQARAKAMLAKRHKVDPKDPLAFGGFNLQEMFQQMSMLFVAISGLSWFVGVLTLIAGVIGIGNIMLVIVKERTKEIGIRRSIGARPGNIAGQIVQEAAALTFIAGYFGLLAGIGVLELINGMHLESGFFKNPEVDLGVALTALAVLIISGLIAGYIPAKRALSIKPVDALRAE
ncbi:MAG: ABC transporter permease [Flavobacteriales bacterium]|nr:ABC transporter permease [Flavobacteriales bacterium]MCL4282238.1 ABC transporter permease [Flavobacteriales bacterium]